MYQVTGWYYSRYQISYVDIVLASHLVYEMTGQYHSGN